jgi:hypothetical protein
VATISLRRVTIDMSMVKMRMGIVRRVSFRDFRVRGAVDCVDARASPVLDANDCAQ